MNKDKDVGERQCKGSGSERVRRIKQKKKGQRGGGRDKQRRHLNVWQHVWGTGRQERSPDRYDQVNQIDEEREREQTKEFKCAVKNVNKK